jgi:hypothetical protein
VSETAKKIARAVQAPIDLDTVKEDLGVVGTADDAWLQRRIDGLWARFQRYTLRPLYTVQRWRDDWSVNVIPHAHIAPPVSPVATVFLRVYPVVSIESVTIAGSTVDPATVKFDAESGRLLGFDGNAFDLGHYLRSSGAVIEYSAGFVEVPADLYETLVGALAVQWNTRQAQASGLTLGGAIPRRIETADVGAMEVGTLAPNYFVERSTIGGVDDPMLGPYARMLDPYVDYRSSFGAPTPTTTVVPVTP